MSNYQMRIGCTNNGVPVVGAAACDAYAIIEERVFPSQFAHRCCVVVDGAWKIMTPTEAATRGAVEVNYFPRANGALGRGGR